ncbi:MAG TPA: hypothetical protein VLE89_06215 [Chlamydiales bacterium]|nr:hypothetical protein [Chlamydiales bacterium]
MKHLSLRMIVLIALAAIVFLWLIKAPVMSSYLTSRLKIPVSMASISMWPRETTIRIFKIPNPRGYKTDNAFKALRIKVEYELGKLLGTPSEIDTITMDGVFVSIEFSNKAGTQNNWTVLGSKIPEEKNSRRVIVHKLILTNIRVEIQGLAAQILGVPKNQMIERMEFDEIDSEQGFPTKKVINRIFENAGVQKYIEELSNPENVFEKFTNPFKGFGGD